MVNKDYHKIDRNYACFGPILVKAPPQQKWTCIIKFSQFPLMWQSFKVIGRGPEGGAEFAGQENDGQRNFRGWKLQKWEMTDESAGLENA